MSLASGRATVGSSCTSAPRAFLCLGGSDKEAGLVLGQGQLDMPGTREGQEKQSSILRPLEEGTILRHVPHGLPGSTEGLGATCPQRRPLCNAPQLVFFPSISLPLPHLLPVTTPGSATVTQAFISESALGEAQTKLRWSQRPPINYNPSSTKIPAGEAHQVPCEGEKPILEAKQGSPPTPAFIICVSLREPPKLSGLPQSQL